MPETSPNSSESGLGDTFRRRIELRRLEVAGFCRRHHIRRPSLFGSVLRGDFRPESDVDILVEFEPGHVPGLLRLSGMELELSKILDGRKTDMNTPGGLGPYLRDEVLQEAVVLYANE